MWVKSNQKQKFICKSMGQGSVDKISLPICCCNPQVQIYHFQQNQEQNNLRISRSHLLQEQKYRITNLHPYLTYLQLDASYFNETQPLRYEQSTIRPPLCVVQLNVKGKFDNGDDSWMHNESKVWVWAYRGISYPNLKNQYGLNTVQSILSALNRKQKDFFKPRDRKVREQGASSKISQIKKGIYVSPDFERGNFYFNYERMGSKNYRLMFKCKVLRQRMDILCNSIWLAEESKLIRPTSIIIIESDLSS